MEGNILGMFSTMSFFEGARKRLSESQWHARFNLHITLLQSYQLHGGEIVTYRNNGIWSESFTKCIKITPKYLASAIRDDNSNDFRCLNKQFSLSVPLSVKYHSANLVKCCMTILMALLMLNILNLLSCNLELNGIF